MNIEAIKRVFGTHKIPERLSDARFPDAETRRKFLEGFSTTERPLVSKGMDWCLDKTNAYTLRQYSLRDAALKAIQADELELAVDILKEIGKIE